MKEDIPPALQVQPTCEDWRGRGKDQESGASSKSSDRQLSCYPKAPHRLWHCPLRQPLPHSGSPEQTSESKPFPGLSLTGRRCQGLKRPLASEVQLLFQLQMTGWTPRSSGLSAFPQSSCVGNAIPTSLC